MIDPLYAFVFLGLFSPGPNVIMLTASGARFGFARTVPHVLGVAIGVGILAGLAGLGVGVVLNGQPALKFALKIAAAAWILRMAWLLFQSTKLDKMAASDRPFSVLQAAIFQWVNPKVWAVVLAAAAGYSTGLGPVAEAQKLAITFASMNLFVCLFWSFAGSLLIYLFTTPTAWRIFNIAMAVALATFAVMVFF
jgi:threonine/homoserine/homoserine lactone efflux protein